MPNVMGREFPYTAEGMAAAQQYSQAMGMRDGGSMGFRPVGYDEGGPVGYADGDVVLDDQSRAAVIEKLMDMTGMGPNTFVPLTNGQLINAVQKVEADALAAQMQQMQQMAPMMEEQIQPMQQMAPAIRVGKDFGDGRISNLDAAAYQKLVAETTMPDPTGFPPEGGDQMLMSRPGMSSMRDNIGMAGGGIMSLRGY